MYAEISDAHAGRKRALLCNSIELHNKRVLEYYGLQSAAAVARPGKLADYRRAQATALRHDLRSQAEILGGLVAKFTKRYGVNLPELRTV